MAEFKALLVDKSKDWEVTINDKKERLVVEQKLSSRGFSMFRARSDADVDPLTAFRTYGNVECRLIYDKNVEDL